MSLNHRPLIKVKKFLILTILAPFIVLLSSAVRINVPEVWYTQNLALLFLFFVAIILVIWDFNKSLAVFIGLCLFSTCFITQWSARAVMLLLHLSLAALTSYGISRIDVRKYKFILKGVLILVVIQTIFLLLQSWNIDPIFKSLIRQGMKETVAFSGSKGQMGTFFALTAPVLAYFHPALLIITLIGIVFSKSSFAFMATFVSILTYFFFTNKKLFVRLFLAILIIATVFFNKIDRLTNADFGMRFDVWKHAVKSIVTGQITLQNQDRQIIIKTNPIWGYGFGNFLRLFPYVPEGKFNFSNEKFTHAHNDYIETFVFELGYSGIIALLFLFRSFIWDFIKTEKSKELMLYFCCIVAYLLNAMGNFLSHIAVSGILLTIFYGMYKGTRRELNGKVAVSC